MMTSPAILKWCVLLTLCGIAAGARDLQQSGGGNSGSGRGRSNSSGRPVISRAVASGSPASGSSNSSTVPAPGASAASSSGSGKGSTSAGGVSSTGPGSPGGAAAAGPDRGFESLPRPKKSECPKPGEDVRGYPSSPFDPRPFVFKTPFKPLSVKKSLGQQCEGGHCITGYSFDIVEFMTDYGFNGTVCAGRSVPTMGYDGESPGPLIDAHAGTQDVTRFVHKVDPMSRYFPPAGPANAEPGYGEPDICANRAERQPGAPVGVGRGFSIHNHGSASLSSMDGWADAYFCAGEIRDYIVPNNRPAGLYYHDHAVGITSENTYFGLSAMRIVRPCNGHDPYQVEDFVNADGSVSPGMEEHQVQLSDFVLAAPRRDEPGVCRRRYDRLGAHEDNLYGDINSVNGVPWPVLSVTAKWHRFRVLNSGSSRAFLLSLKDSSGKDISKSTCSIIGAGGGVVPAAIPMPSGLMTDIAFRYDIVCDFRALSGKTVYLYNEEDKDRLTSEVPYFCYSHLLMRINVGAPEAGREPDLTARTLIDQNQQLPVKLLQALEKRALAGEYDRRVDFGKGGIWNINGNGWETRPKGLAQRPIEYDNIGQNNIELWNLKSGGGWYHPIHLHLMDMFCLAIKDSGWQRCPPELRTVPKDSVHIGANIREMIVGARFGPHIGEWMFHCHNTVHEDHDMMRAFAVIDAQNGLTFRQTPPLNFTLLAGTPVEAEDANPLSRRTTYAAGAAPPLDDAYLLDLLRRRLYSIFFPQPGSPLDDLDTNIWLGTCEAGRILQ